MTLQKRPPVVSQKLRDSARGQPCTLRLSCCNSDPATSVLCHVPCNMRGTGLKGPDCVAVIGCSACHAALDREPWTVDAWDVIRALTETWMYWLREGLVTVKGAK